MILMNNMDPAVIEALKDIVKKDLRNELEELK